MKISRIFFVFLLTASFAFGQKTVTGVVSDPDGLPLPGATVVVDGTTMYVPLDPANRHYAEILRQVEAGTLTITEAE